MNLIENGAIGRTCAKKWEPLIESKKFNRITNPANKMNMGVLLQNQYDYMKKRGLVKEGNVPQNMGVSNSTAVYGQNTNLYGGNVGSADSFAPGDFRNPAIILPMIRRTWGSLVANDVVGVQPMLGPVGLAYAMRYHYVGEGMQYGDTATQHRHDFADDVVGDPKGTRGVDSKFKYDPADPNYVVILQRNEFPTKIPVAVYDYERQKFVVNPVVYQIFNAKQVEALHAEGTLMRGKYVYDSVEAVGTAIKSKAFSPDDGTSPLAQAIEGQVVGLHNDTKQINATNTELGYQRLDTRFTGRADGRLAQAMAGGRVKLRPEDIGVAVPTSQYENTGAIAQVRFSFEKITVEAGTRKVGSSWSTELEEDIKNTNGMDISTEVTQTLAFEIRSEIDRELVIRMMVAALQGNSYSVWSAAMADGRWMEERYKSFLNAINKQSNRMHMRNRRGPANFIIATPDVITILETLDQYVPTGASDTSSLSTTKCGTLMGNRYTVYVDNRTSTYSPDDYGYGFDEYYDSSVTSSNVKVPNYCLLGYKGKETWDAGIVYCPYIPLMVSTANDPVSFGSNLCLSTRYGIADNIFGAHLYYHMILVDTFSQPGLAQTPQLFPAGNVGYNETMVKTAKYSMPVQHATASSNNTVTPIE